MRKPLLWSIGAFMTLTLLVWLLLPSRHRGERVEDVKCRSNLRQLWMGLEQYAQRYNGAFAPSTASLLVYTDLVPELFVCPKSEDEPSRTRDLAQIRSDFAWGGHCSYELAPPSPLWSEVRSQDVIAFERKPHHQNGIHVLMGDGSINLTSGDYALDLLDQFAQGIRPIRLRPATE